MAKYIILCSTGFLLSVFLAAGFAAEHFPYAAQVSRESVNVRSGPNINFEKVGQLNRGAKVVVLGRSYEWLKVQPPPQTKAYIRSDYLKMKGDGVAEVSGDHVIVRCLPNTDSSSLGELRKGTLVRVLGTAQGWSLLAPVAGTAVWINQGFLKEISADVPPSLLIPAVSSAPAAPVVAPVAPPPAKKAPVAESPWVSMRGTVEALVQPLAPDVHYEIVLDDKSVFLLQDIPRISYFCNTVVNVEGGVVPDPQKKLMYPLLHINKISLVL
ncbi:MAG: SH3 domain-containing protein [Candidatus Omnitrophica bacterium]|nr:SH3 domain-containing protein [Candidatus Omnitrophota bacterium]MDE2010207.1 SH3 domain-containing protein [Candidatus Omnitrophota bacterium]MDE2215251.1 SH3 domain-containing protein [Candidatus Omnitrophota bacterium]MDE2231701.1 SH3 domain-containing protein [Candidatus Omnitrophota bacterium]